MSSKYDYFNKTDSTYSISLLICQHSKSFETTLQFSITYKYFKMLSYHYVMKKIELTCVCMADGSIQAGVFVTSPSQPSPLLLLSSNCSAVVVLFLLISSASPAFCVASVFDASNLLPASVAIAGVLTKTLSPKLLCCCLYCEAVLTCVELLLFDNSV